MSAIVGLAAFSSMAVGVAFSTLWQFRRASHSRFVAEMQRIELSTEMLRDHGQALDKFLFLPDAPEVLKTFLLTASDLFENRQFARFMASKIRTGLKSEASGESEIWHQAQLLCAKDSEAYDLFLQALFAGMTAALLRWPETAPVVSRPFPPTQVFIKGEVMMTARAIHENTSKAWSGDLLPA